MESVESKDERAKEQHGLGLNTVPSMVVPNEPYPSRLEIERGLVEGMNEGKEKVDAYMRLYERMSTAQPQHYVEETPPASVVGQEPPVMRDSYMDPDLRKATDAGEVTAPSSFMRGFAASRSTSPVVARNGSGPNSPDQSDVFPRGNSSGPLRSQSQMRDTFYPAVLTSTEKSTGRNWFDEALHGSIFPTESYNASIHSQDRELLADRYAGLQTRNSSRFEQIARDEQESISKRWREQEALERNGRFYKDPMLREKDEVSEKWVAVQSEKRLLEEKMDILKGTVERYGSPSSSGIPARQPLEAWVSPITVREEIGGQDDLQRRKEKDRIRRDREKAAAAKLEDDAVRELLGLSADARLQVQDTAAFSPEQERDPREAFQSMMGGGVRGQPAHYQKEKSQAFPLTKTRPRVEPIHQASHLWPGATQPLYGGLGAVGHPRSSSPLRNASQELDELISSASKALPPQAGGALGSLAEPRMGYPSHS